ncbi:MAG: hypothetical protein RL386_385 [Bacteroidota bacterium]|jgi:uncharacterized membrane protein
MTQKTMLQRVRSFLFTAIIGGLVVILPVTLLIWLLRSAVVMIARFLNPVKSLLQLPEEWAGWLVDLGAFFIAILFFFLIGVIMQTRVGRLFFRELEERLLAPLPLYTVLRDVVQQITGYGKRTPFRDVVLADVYSNPTRMLGFVVDELPDDYLSLFVPTGPNPTNGFIFFCHKSQVTYLNVRPEDAVRVVIGVGTGAAALFRDNPGAFQRPL